MCAKIRFDILKGFVSDALPKDRNYAIDTLKKLNLIEKTIRTVSSSGLDEDVKKEVKKSQLISMVTVTEVFLKNLIIENSGQWNRKGVNELMKERISLKEAFELFSIKSVKEEHIIAHISNFQNYSSICNVFDKLTDASFNANIESFRKNIKDGNEFGLSDGWQGKIKEVFFRRHQMIHEGIDPKFTDIELGEYLLTVMGFVLLVYLYCLSTYDAKAYAAFTSESGLN